MRYSRERRITPKPAVFMPQHCTVGLRSFTSAIAWPSLSLKPERVMSCIRLVAAFAPVMGAALVDCSGSSFSTPDLVGVTLQPLSPPPKPTTKLRGRKTVSSTAPAPPAEQPAGSSIRPHGDGVCGLDHVNPPGHATGRSAIPKVQILAILARRPEPHILGGADEQSRRNVRPGADHAGPAVVAIRILRIDAGTIASIR